MSNDTDDADDLALRFARHNSALISVIQDRYGEEAAREIGEAARELDGPWPNRVLALDHREAVVVWYALVLVAGGWETFGPEGREAAQRVMERLFSLHEIVSAAVTNEGKEGITDRLTRQSHVAAMARFGQGPAEMCPACHGVVDPDTLPPSLRTFHDQGHPVPKKDR